MNRQLINWILNGKILTYIKTGAIMLTKTKKILEWSIFSFLGVILITASSLFGYQQAYAGKIYKNVYVSNIDLSGKTKTQASFLLQKKFDSVINDEITLKTDTKDIKTKVSDTGLTLNVDKIIQDSYKVGRSDTFFNQLVNSTETLWKKKNIQVEPKIDQEKFNKFMEVAVAQLNYEPQNASITIENGEIKEIAEKDGQTVDASNLTEKILALADDNSSKIISLQTQKTLPKIKTANFEPARAYAKSILEKKFTLKYEDTTFIPSKAEIGPWISFVENNGQYSATLNEGNVQAYLNKIGKKFEVTKKDRKINGNDGSVIEEGQEGKYLDKNNALSQIKSQLNSTNSITVNLTTYTVPPNDIKLFPAEGVIPGRFEGRYIDISLTDQKLCRIDGPAVVDCFIISSGKPGMETPTGTFTINDKNPRHWSNKYSMWLPWWEQFKEGGWGIHELPETDTWKETSEHLGTPVSHGCVRLDVGPAETVYNWTSIGTPVYIHK
ncbi:MAG: L,D-transpeptidase/peptidoglycan binding protein [Patescibacteria group bacterium]|nr:L,D-transpeptidase/peptidoglycan binding protein [Patescibacteria group bacterium]